jgi:hypothetical protein
MYSKDSTTIGDILVDENIISSDQLNIALKLQETARTTGSELVDRGVISPYELRLALEVLLVDILIGLGYADEGEIYGTYPACDIKTNDYAEVMSIFGN